jgi:hypothetical protein
MSTTRSMCRVSNLCWYTTTKKGSAPTSIDNKTKHNPQKTRNAPHEVQLAAQNAGEEGEVVVPQFGPHGAPLRLHEVVEGVERLGMPVGL